MTQLTPSWHPEGQWLPLASFGGARVHFVRPRPGEGVPLLLLHGFAQSSWAWRFVLPELARDFDAIAVCLPGLGWSDKPPHASYRHALQVERLVELLDELRLPTTHLCGNSMGGAIALRLAAEHRERVQRLVLIGPAAHGMFPAALLAETQHEAMAPLWSLPGLDKLLRLGLQHGAYKHLPVDDHYMAHFLAPLRATGGVAATLRVARYFRRDLQALEPFLPQVAAPTLVIWGEHDRLVPRHIVRHVMRRVPHARLHVYPECGHCPQEEQPQRCIADMRDFLQEAP